MRRLTVVLAAATLQAGDHGGGRRLHRPRRGGHPDQPALRRQQHPAVTDAEFTALVEDLVKSLDKFKVPAREKNELLAALGGMKPHIVGQ